MGSMFRVCAARLFLDLYGFVPMDRFALVLGLIGVAIDKSLKVSGLESCNPLSGLDK
jgi:hypothetical protein